MNLVHEARVVVSHGGVGSILIALTHGKQPLVVPRLKRFGEVVDDHQLLLARRLAHEGLIGLVEDPADLGAWLGAHEAVSKALARTDQGLPDELADYLHLVTGKSRAVA